MANCIQRLPDYHSLQFITRWIKGKLNWNSIIFICFFFFFFFFNTVDVSKCNRRNFKYYLLDRSYPFENNSFRKAKSSPKAKSNRAMLENKVEIIDKLYQIQKKSENIDASC